tara:strand:+ start:33 stop:257 length:225 start_codon:yes stop_codon:yes gene_type:complete
MTDISKLTKKQLLEFIIKQEELKFDDFKAEFGMPYNTDEEWIDFIKSLQETNKLLIEEKKDIDEKIAQGVRFRS